MNIFSFQTLCKWRSNKAVVWHSFNFGLNPLIKRIAIPLLRNEKTMRKSTFVSIYIFCVLYGCAPYAIKSDDTGYFEKAYLLERERLLDRAPTFLEVNGKKANGKNMKEKSNWMWRDSSRTCGWNPYDCFKEKYARQSEKKLYDE